MQRRQCCGHIDRDDTTRRTVFRPGKQESRMDSKNYTQVLIDGKIYTLGGSEDEAYLQKAASYVNDKNGQMRRLPGFSKQNADYQMVMTELNIADDYFKALEWGEGMERQKNDMEKETYSLKHELVSTQMKLEAVLKDLEERQKELDRLGRSKEQLEGELKEAREELEAYRTSRAAAAAQVQDKDIQAAVDEAAAGTETQASAEVQDLAETQVSAGVQDLAEAQASAGVRDLMETQNLPEAQNQAAESDTAAESETVMESDTMSKAETVAEVETVSEIKTIAELRTAREMEKAQSETVKMTGAPEAAAALHNTSISDEELAKKALQAAKKANSHRGGRR